VAGYTRHQQFSRAARYDASCRDENSRQPEKPQDIAEAFHQPKRLRARAKKEKATDKEFPGRPQE
jgi:hypothetical protein